MNVSKRFEKLFSVFFYTLHVLHTFKNFILLDFPFNSEKMYHTRQSFVSKSRCIRRLLPWGQLSRRKSKKSFFSFLYLHANNLDIYTLCTYNFNFRIPHFDRIRWIPESLGPTADLSEAKKTTSMDISLRPCVST